ncbi:MAG: HD domain-containing protein [Thermodesulfobacteriota bacterium]|nr:HD domain-containing protein [Thermodesulfobacteriota bacterium]
MISETKRAELITQISLDINEVKDLDILLERILSRAREFFNADAGSIYLKQGNDLKFSYTQNNTLEERLGPGNKLIYNTYLVPINNDSIAGYVAKNRDLVNIEDAYKMSGSEPFAFDSHFDTLSDYRTSSILTVPAMNQRGDLLGVMQLINATDDQGRVTAFSRADESLAKYFAASAALALERAQMTRNIIMRMVGMAELRDPEETGAHVNRVASFAVEIYEAWARKEGMALSEVERDKDVLRMAAMLHDVGKVAVSDMILKKPGPLTANEFEEMKSHTYMGARLFQEINSDFDEVAAQVTLNHHEKWDGTGYPGHMDPFSKRSIPGHEDSQGSPLPKKGDEIPLFSRFVAVADVYDALVSRRAYKEAWDQDRVLEEMHRNSGTHFDPKVMDAFFSRTEVLASIIDRYPDRMDPLS